VSRDESGRQGPNINRFNRLEAGEAVAKRRFVKTTSLIAVVLLGLFSSASAEARDWFVRAGAEGGDGSQARPFNDPWQALDKCEAGDAVHVAGGKYFGRSNTGVWEIPFDDVTLLGGYDADFKTRDPWKNLTQLLWEKTSKSSPIEARLRSTKKNTVIDGVVIDQRDQCRYETEAQTGRAEKPCESAMHFWVPATVRNCVVINPGLDGIVAAAGSTLENNLIVNAVNWGININKTTDNQAIATIKNNTVAFTFSFKEPGKGAYDGSGIALKGPANVTQNIIAFSDSNGLYITASNEKVSLTQNVFFMNLWSNAKVYVDNKDTPIDDKSMDLLEEVGLKAFEGNLVKNPQLPLDPKWMDAVSKRTSATPGKLVMDDFNQTRKLLGLNLIEKGGTPPSGVAPAMDLDDALKLLNPKNAGKAGARVLPLKVSFQGTGASAVQRDYVKVEPKSWVKDPGPADGKAFQMVVALASVANIDGIPSQFKKAEHAGVSLHQPDGDYAPMVGFFKTGSSVDRTVTPAMGYWRGSGKPNRLFVVKGVAYAIKWVPKAAFLIDSIEEYEAPQASAARTPGKDWFVRAGAQGGDGSKARPFKDPWQALEKMESGDFIHVAEGDYFGKLKAGIWKIDTTNITLLGGYDASFKERNPWKHPTRLTCPPDYKGRRGGNTIEGVDDHTGAVVDGFVFDKVANNQYTPEGDLLYSRSDSADHIWFAKNDVVIRNNIFVNGAMGAIRAQSGQTIENNIFINHYQQTVHADRAFEGPFIFRNNTVVFSWEVKFGEGHGRGGTLLTVGSGFKSIIDNNIFEFSDNDAVWIGTTNDASDIELTNNVFGHNLYSHVRRPIDSVTVDDNNWAQLADFKFKKVSGNVLMSSGVVVDQKWFDVYLSRTAMTPGKVKMDDWNQLREMLGQPVMATGGVAGRGLSPAYPWEKALQAFPKNPKVTAGARARDLPVSFTGVERKVLSFDYTDVTWDNVAASKDDWEKLVGRRVALKVVFNDIDSQYYLPEVSQDLFTAFKVTGPEGSSSKGLPLRGYVKKGGKPERVVRQAKSYSSGAVEQWYVLKGVAKPGKQLVVEVVERAE